MTPEQALAGHVVKMVLAAKKDRDSGGITSGQSAAIGAGTGVLAKTIDFPFSLRSRAEDFSATPRGKSGRPKPHTPRGGPVGRGAYKVLGIPKGRKVRWGRAANRILASEVVGSVAKGVTFVTVPAIATRAIIARSGEK